MTEVRPGAKHIYTCKEGDTWTIWNHHLIVANPAHPPFMIELSTGNRKEIDPNAPLKAQEAPFMEPGPTDD